MIAELTLDKVVRLNKSLGMAIEFLKSYPHAIGTKSRLILDGDENVVLAYSYGKSEYEIEFTEDGCSIIFEAVPDSEKLSIPSLIEYLRSKEA